MDFEMLVMHYLAAHGMFLSPQFSIKDGGKEWSCPDFIALDFRTKQILVVEVTTAYNVKTLVRKVQNREEQWFSRLIQQLENSGIPMEGWKLAVKVFVRGDRFGLVQSKFLDQPDVDVVDLEKIAFPWKWDWNELQKGQSKSEWSHVRIVRDGA